MSLLNLRGALGPDWPFFSPLSAAARITAAFLYANFVAKNSLLDELLNPIYKIRTVQISSWAILPLWYMTPVSAREKQRMWEARWGQEEGGTSVTKGHFRAPEIPWMFRSPGCIWNSVTVVQKGATTECLCKSPFLLVIWWSGTVERIKIPLRKKKNSAAFGALR